VEPAEVEEEDEEEELLESKAPCAGRAVTGGAVFVFTNGDAGTRVYDRVVSHATGHDHPAMFWL
jgi:hypothetical protein